MSDDETTSWVPSSLDLDGDDIETKTWCELTRGMDSIMVTHPGAKLALHPNAEKNNPNIPCRDDENETCDPAAETTADPGCECDARYSWSHPDNWMSFDRARELSGGDYDDALMVVMQRESEPYHEPADSALVIDGDNVVDRNERIHPGYREVVHTICPDPSYLSVSSSIEGAHTVTTGELPGDTKQLTIELSRDVDGFDTAHVDDDEDIHIDIFDGKHLRKATGYHVAETPLEAASVDENALAEYCDEEPDSHSVDEEGATETSGGIAGTLRAEASSVSTGENPDLDDEELIEVAKGFKNGDTIAALWDGDISKWAELRESKPGQDNSHSGARMSLLWHLAFLTGKDSTQMDRMYRDSGLHPHPSKPGKWDRVGNEEIETAIEAQDDVYTGDGVGVDLNAEVMNLSREIEAAGDLRSTTDQMQEEQDVTEEFAVEFADALFVNDGVIDDAASVVSHGAMYNKTRARDVITEHVKKHAEEANRERESDDDHIPLLDIIDDETRLPRIIKQETTDYVQDATYRFEFVDGTVTTNVKGNGQAHNSPPDFNDEYFDATNNNTALPEGELRNPEKWKKHIRDIIIERVETRTTVGPRTRAVDAIEAMIQRRVGVPTHSDAMGAQNRVCAIDTEPPFPAIVHINEASRDVIPDDEIHIPNQAIRDLLDEKKIDIGLNEVVAELSHRGHTSDRIKGVSERQTVNGNQVRFWVLDTDFATPQSYDRSPGATTPGSGRDLRRMDTHSGGLINTTD